MSVLAALDEWLEIEFGGEERTELAVLEVELDEGISRPYAIDVTLVGRGEEGVEASSLLETGAALVLRLDTSRVRYFHGVVASVDRWDMGSGPERQRYVVRIVPRLSRLGLNRTSRIFQDLTIPEIATQVLKQGGVEVRSTLSRVYPPREYCVQYQESDLEFVQRLLEEAGIFYWFEHRQDGHTMVLADATRSCPELPEEQRVVFREPSGMLTEEHVDAFRVRRQVRPGSVTLRDFDFVRPQLDLTAGASAQAEDIEVYDYPGGFTDEGGQVARDRLEEARSTAEVASGSGVVRQWRRVAGSSSRTTPRERSTRSTRSSA